MSAALRRARQADLEVLADMAHEGFRGYAAFAAPGWEPPPREVFRDELAGHLAHDHFWCLLAEVDDKPAGHVAFMPAEASRWAINEPGVAHVFQLFVRPPYHGTGLAAELLNAALHEMRVRAFASARLLTPAGQARARRFYEREGWHAAGQAFHVAELGLDLVEYRRALGGGP